LAGLNRERQATFSPDFQAKRNGLFDVLDGLFLRLALADTARNGRAFNHPSPVLVTVNGNRKFDCSVLNGFCLFSRHFPLRLPVRCPVRRSLGEGGSSSGLRIPKAKLDANTRTLRPDKCLVVSSLSPGLRPDCPRNTGANAATTRIVYVTALASAFAKARRTKRVMALP
jgi:hypothetical protein